MWENENLSISLNEVNSFIFLQQSMTNIVIKVYIVTILDFVGHRPFSKLLTPIHYGEEVAIDNA